MSVFIPGPELLLSPLGRVMDGSSDFDLDAGGISLPERCDIVIIGSGLAGIAAATHLWHAGRRDFILVDPHSRPAAQFFQRVDMLEQTVMRSPYEHHPGAEGYADCELLDFARFNWHVLTTQERAQVRMAQSGQRSVVPLDVFRAFCARVAAMHELPGKISRAEVTALSACSDGIVVTTTTGQTKARQVIAAVGEVPVRAPAEWQLPDAGPVSYWDHPGTVSGVDRVAVVGSGLSAAHLIRLHLSQGRQVIWIQRSREKFQCADVDASYFRPEGRALYARLGRSGREALIRRQRRPSIMFEFSPGLREAEAAGQLLVHRNAGRIQVRAVDEHSATVITESGYGLPVDHVILALGTHPAALPELWSHPSRRLAVDDMRIDDRSLKVADMGSLYISGAWATAALGPAARNIDGHRFAAQRICADIAAGA